MSILTRYFDKYLPFTKRSEKYNRFQEYIYPESLGKYEVPNIVPMPNKKVGNDFNKLSPVDQYLLHNFGGPIAGTSYMYNSGGSPIPYTNYQRSADLTRDRIYGAANAEADYYNSKHPHPVPPGMVSSRIPTGSKQFSRALRDSEGRKYTNNVPIGPLATHMRGEANFRATKERLRRIRAGTEAKPPKSGPGIKNLYYTGEGPPQRREAKDIFYTSPTRTGGTDPIDMVSGYEAEKRELRTLPPKSKTEEIPVPTTTSKLAPDQMGPPVPTEAQREAAKKPVPGPISGPHLPPTMTSFQKFWAGLKPYLPYLGVTSGGLGLLSTFMSKDKDKSLTSYLPWLALGALGGYGAYKGWASGPTAAQQKINQWRQNYPQASGTQPKT